VDPTAHLMPIARNASVTPGLQGDPASTCLLTLLCTWIQQ